MHKVVLHTLLACVNDVRRLKSDPGFTDDILNFNEVYAEGNTANTSQKISNYSEAFQVSWIYLKKLNRTIRSLFFMLLLDSTSSTVTFSHYFGANRKSTERRRQGKSWRNCKTIVK